MTDRQKLLKFINERDTATLMVSVMGERDTLRKTYVLNRGVYDAANMMKFVLQHCLLL